MKQAHSSMSDLNEFLGQVKTTLIGGCRFILFANNEHFFSSQSSSLRFLVLGILPLDVTASSGTAISIDFATLTCSETLSKILIRCVTWH